MKKIFKKLKKIILVFLTIFIISLAIVPKAHAAVTTSWYNQSFEDWFLRVYTGNDSEIFGERYTAAQVQWILYSIQAQIIRLLLFGNMDAAACVMGGGIDNCTDAIENVMKDLVTYSPQTTSFLANMTSNPVSGIGYISSLVNKFKIIPEANAQASETGFGFSAISPVQEVWKISRDISYGFLVIVIIAFAFMIMFRVKINPQTVITIQSALPKVIFAIILITFSYAIAGLLIDLMYVILVLLIAIVTNGGLFGYDLTKMISFVLGRNIFEIYMGYWAGFMWASLSTIASPNIIFGIILTLFAIIAFFILLIQSVKGIIALLKNFAMIMIAIITGPFEILFGTLSNSGGGFGAWFMKLISYLAVYPVITLIILMAHWFLAQGMPGKTVGQAVISLPFDPIVKTSGTGTWNAPFTVWEINGIKVIWIVVSYVLITMIPKVFDIIKSFMERKPFDYGTAIGEAMGPARWAGRQAQGLLNVPLGAIREASSYTTGAWMLRQAQRVFPVNTRIGKTIAAQEELLNLKSKGTTQFVQTPQKRGSKK